jgi:hypothetical protein
MKNKYILLILGILLLFPFVNAVDVSTCSELQSATEMINLTGNIDCSDTINWNGGKGFEPLVFEAGIEGNGYNITGLYINRQDETYVGLFTVITGPVQNLGLINTNIIGGIITGSVAGSFYGTNGINLTVTGIVQCNVSQCSAGGITGNMNNNGAITSSTFDGIVIGTGDWLSGGSWGLGYNGVGALVGRGNGGCSDSNSSANIYGYGNVGLGYNLWGTHPNSFFNHGNSVFTGTKTTLTDVTKPSYSNKSINNTYSGNITNFAIKTNDNWRLGPNGRYIFSTDNTGTWVNDSAVYFADASVPQWANVTKTLGTNPIVSYMWYFIDNAGNTNSTEIYTLIVEGIPEEEQQKSMEVVITQRAPIFSIIDVNRAKEVFSTISSFSTVGTGEGLGNWFDKNKNTLIVILIIAGAIVLLKKK